MGCVEEDKIINTSNVVEGNILIGIESSGAHSNGYSLIRKILDESSCSDDEKNDMANTFLKPTHLYPTLINQLLNAYSINSLSRDSEFIE